MLSFARSGRVIFYDLSIALFTQVVKQPLCCYVVTKLNISVDKWHGSFRYATFAVAHSLARDATATYLHINIHVLAYRMPVVSWLVNSCSIYIPN